MHRKDPIVSVHFVLLCHRLDPANFRALTLFPIATTSKLGGRLRSATPASVAEAEMRGGDLINTLLPDEILYEVFRRLDGHKSACDAASLVCKRWLRLDRASRRTVRIGASGSPDVFVSSVLRRFHSLRNVFVDERLTVSCSSFPCSFAAPHTRTLLVRFPHRKIFWYFWAKI